MSKKIELDISKCPINGKFGNMMKACVNKFNWKKMGRTPVKIIKIKPNESKVFPPSDRLIVL
jgi:hypothetical protein